MSNPSPIIDSMIEETQHRRRAWSAYRRMLGSEAHSHPQRMDFARLKAALGKSDDDVAADREALSAYRRGLADLRRLKMKYPELLADDPG